MSFNLQDFKSNYLNNDLLRSSHYAVKCTKFGREYLFMTESIDIPGIGFYNSDNVRPYGFGPTYTIPYGLNINEISCVHLIEGKSAATIKMFEDWTHEIVDWKNSYSAGYLNDYAAQVNIFTYSPDRSLAREFILREAFPISFNSVPMPWATIDDVTRLTVNYKFTDWQSL